MMPKKIFIEYYDFTTHKGVERDVNMYLSRHPDSRVAGVGKEGSRWYVFYESKA